MFQFEERVIGLDLGASTVKVVHLKTGKQRPEVLGAGGARLPDGVIDDTGIVQPELVADGIREALSAAGVGRGTRQVVAGIPGKHLIVRLLTIPTMDHSELREAIKWESAQYLPYPVDEAVFDYIELGAGAGNLEVVSISTRKSVVEGIVKAVELAGLELIALDAVPLALGRIFAPESTEYEAFPGYAQAAATREGAPDHAIAVADIGHLSTDVSIFRNGRLRVCRSIPGGSDRFTAAIAEALGADAQAAEEAKRGLVSLTDEPTSERGQAIVVAAREVATALGDEIQRSFDYFRAQNHWLPISALVLTGGGAKLAGLDRFLAGHLSIDVKQGDDAFATMAPNLRKVQTGALTPVSLGLALWEVNGE